MRRIVTGRARHATSRVCSRATQIKAFNRGPILRPARHRPHKKELVHAQIAVKNVALGEPIRAFEIQRCKHLVRDDRVGHVRSMLGDFPNDAITQQSALLIPGSLPKVIGDVLHEAGHDVRARRSQRIVGIGRN